MKFGRAPATESTSRTVRRHGRPSFVEPRREALESFLEREGRRVSELVRARVDVGVGHLHVAGHLGQALDRRLASERLLERADSSLRLTVRDSPRL